MNLIELDGALRRERVGRGSPVTGCRCGSTISDIPGRDQKQSPAPRRRAESGANMAETLTSAELAQLIRRVFSPTTLATFRLGYSRTRIGQDVEANVDLPVFDTTRLHAEAAMDFALAPDP